MKYKQLNSFYYQNKAVYEQEYNNRYNSLSTLRLPISINDNGMFLMILPEMIESLEKIQMNNSKILEIFINLPGVAKSSYINECMIDEIITTNGIEGVHSTRKEIQIAIDKNLNKDKVEEKKKRFEGLIKKYIAILNNEQTDIKSCEDIVEIYNELVKPEISTDNLPDGKLFRKDSVTVQSKTDKTIHHGVMPEDKIIECINGLINVINDDTIPYIIKSAIAQYYIGYVHPFYDGNGRLSRFIGSLLLSRSINPLVSIRLSYTIKENINKYYKAFMDCNNKKNKGDVTPFVLFIFDMLLEATEDIFESLKEKQEKLDFYRKKAVDIFYNIDKNPSLQLDLLDIFIQNALFTSEKLDLKTLEENVNKSYTTISIAISKLKSMGIPIIDEKDGIKKLYKLDIDEF